MFNLGSHLNNVAITQNLSIPHAGARVPGSCPGEDLLPWLRPQLAVHADLDKSLPDLLHNLPLAHLLILEGAGGLHRVQGEDQEDRQQGHANYVELNLHIVGCDNNDDDE